MRLKSINYHDVIKENDDDTFSPRLSKICLVDRFKMYDYLSKSLIVLTEYNEKYDGDKNCCVYSNVRLDFIEQDIRRGNIYISGRKFDMMSSIKICTDDEKYPCRTIIANNVKIELCKNTPLPLARLCYSHIVIRIKDHLPDTFLEKLGPTTKLYLEFDGYFLFGDALRWVLDTNFVYNHDRVTANGCFEELQTPNPFEFNEDRDSNLKRITSIAEPDLSETQILEKIEYDDIEFPIEFLIT
jgi:hypothetical protein